MKKRMIFFLSCILAGCGISSPDIIDPPVMNPIKTQIKDMTLEEKVAQLFIVRPESFDRTLRADMINDTQKYGMTDISETVKQALKQYPVGGIILFSKNLLNPEQLVSMTDSLHSSLELKPMIAIDEEGGSVSRIGNNTHFDVETFESMQAVGDTKEIQNAEYAGNTIGHYLKQYGLDLNFAPVADINSNPDNIVIGSRSFGNDPQLVSDMSFAYIQGLHEAGIISCMKHFPGHGDTQDDPHHTSVSLMKSWEELKKNELIPFYNSLTVSDMIMVAHITLPRISSDHLPASLSKEIITNHLRDEMHFEGVIITDSLSMGAITQNYSSAESARMVIEAGADMILMPHDFYEAYNSLLTAIKNGEISEERIDQSLYRILSLKDKYGLLS